MTEFEKFEVFNNMGELSFLALSSFSTHLGIYLTLLFSFLLVAYIAGAKLSRFQVTTVSLMFFMAAELQAALMFNFVSASSYFADTAREFVPESLGTLDLRGRRGPTRVLGTVLWQIGIFAALLFMWDARRAKGE